MTTQTITSDYAGAFYLRSPMTTLSIAAAGVVEGNGRYGVAALAATAAYTVINSGAVHGGEFGVFLTDGGSVTSSNLIDGAQGVLIRGAAGTVDNTGDITGTAYGAVYLGHGGSVNNSGLLTGSVLGAQVTGAAGTVTNYGTIETTGEGAFDVGVALEHGGRFVNGSASATGASIFASNGVLVENGRGTVINYGVIVPQTSSASFGGVYLADGGSVTNDHGGEITSFSAGVKIVGSGTVTNSGLIGADTTIAGSAGVYLSGAGRITNEANGLIVGYTGVVLNGAGTVNNFGAIAGGGHYSVDFKTAGSTLIAEGGSKFTGEAWGGGGKLDFSNGTGDFDSIAAGGAVSLVQGGAYPDALFADFSTVEIAKTAKFTLTGTGDVTVGNLDVLGTLAVTGTLTTSAAINGTGTLALDGGTTTFNTGTDLAIVEVSESGAATVATFAAKNLTVADGWTQTSGVIMVNADDKVAFTGTGNVFSGTLAGAGTVAFAGGSDTLSGTTLEGSVVIDGPGVTLAGDIDLSKTLTVSEGGLIIAAAGATLSGGGILTLSGDTVVTGSLLVNGDRIRGEGQLGEAALGLVNEAAGVIVGNTTGSLVIDTGVDTLINQGLIENTSTGSILIRHAVDNTGTLQASKGILTVVGDVTGAGVVRVNGGTVGFVATFSENVNFSVAGGELKLADSQGYGGSISGFSKTGASTFDLEDISFGADAIASYSGTTKSGVLTVTDGTDTASINLTGNYTGVTFIVTSDGSGGTLVTAAIPPAPSAATALAAAIAGFAPASAVNATPGSHHEAMARPVLANSHA